MVRDATVHHAKSPSFQSQQPYKFEGPKDDLFPQLKMKGNNLSKSISSRSKIVFVDEDAISFNNEN